MLQKAHRIFSHALFPFVRKCLMEEFHTADPDDEFVKATARWAAEDRARQAEATKLRATDLPAAEAALAVVGPSSSKQAKQARKALEKTRNACVQHLWIAERFAGFADEFAAIGVSVDDLLQGGDAVANKTRDDLIRKHPDKYNRGNFPLGPATKRLRAAVKTEAADRAKVVPLWVRQAQIPFGKVMKTFIKDNGKV